MSQSEYWQKNYIKYPSSNDYDGWLDHHAREILPGMQALDLGCGTGVNIPALLNLGAVVTAADLSEIAAASVQDRYGRALQQVDCFDMRCGLPYGDASFDIVVSDLTLHYFSWEETRRIIAEIRRILKTEGRLIARVHALENLAHIPEAQIEEHYYMVDGLVRRYFTREEIEQLFSDWDLQILQKNAIHRYRRTKHVLEFTAKKR